MMSTLRLTTGLPQAEGLPQDNFVNPNELNKLNANCCAIRSRSSTNSRNSSPSTSKAESGHLMLAALARPFRHAAPPGAFDFMQEAGGDRRRNWSARLRGDLARPAQCKVAVARGRAHPRQPRADLPRRCSSTSPAPSTATARALSALEAVQKLLRSSARAGGRLLARFRPRTAGAADRGLLLAARRRMRPSRSRRCTMRIRRQPRAPHRPLDLRFETFRRDLELPALDAARRTRC